MRDIVFEEVYRKRVEAMLDSAFNQGAQNGLLQAVQIISEMNNAKVDVTPDSFGKAFMYKQMELAKKVQGDVSGESEDSVNTSPSQDIKEPAKKPSFTIVK
jgi:hypothetical protein